MAEQWELILNNWTLGMSPEKYSWGSYLYAEGINTTNNSKSFRLSYWLRTPDIINYRNNWDVILNDNTSLWQIRLTKDWYLEAAAYTEFWTKGWTYWPIFRRENNYVNGIVIGDTILGISATKIDRFIGNNLIGSQLVSVPELTSAWSWTVWSWWTVWASWAVHTTWTAALTHSLAWITGNFCRVIVRITWCTTGTLSVRHKTTTLRTLGSLDNNQSIGLYLTGSWTDTINLVPSTDFNGTVEYCGVNNESSNIKHNEISITSSTQHPVLLDWVILYIGCGSVINAINTSTWTADPEISIFNTNDTIVGIARVGANIVVLTNDGRNTKQIYCDSTLSSIQETIVMDSIKLQWITTNWPTIYAVFDKYYTRELDIISWYNKQLIAKWMEINNNSSDSLAGRVEDKYDFYVQYPNVFRYLDWKLYIPSKQGLYMYGKEYWSTNTITKPYDFGENNIVTSTNFFNGRVYMCRSIYENWVRRNESTSIREYSNYTSWFLITNPILWDNLWSKKDIRKMSLWYKIQRSTSYIDIRVWVNDRYFWTFYVSWVTTYPSVWDIYTSNSNIYTVISIDETNWTISCYCDNLQIWYISNTWTLTKSSWTWQSSISFTDYENFVKIKTITSDRFKIWSELIFKDTFLEKNFPDWYNIQFKIWLTSSSYIWTPEVFDIRLSSDIIDNND